MAMDIHEAEEELNKAQATDTKYRENQQRRIDDIGHETRGRGGRRQTSGRMRRQINNDSSIIPLLKGSLISEIALSIGGNKTTWQDVKDFWQIFQSHFHAAAKDKAHYIDMRADDELSYIFKTVGISQSVKEQLDREIAEIEAQEADRTALLNEGQYGPFGADYRIHTLSTLYAVRVHPVTGQKAFCENRVAELQARAPASDSSCSVVVYGTVLTSSLRGMHIKAADPNSQDAIKVTTSDKAEVAAAAPIKVQPPQYNLHLNG
jgi:hypothetical protein